MKMGPHLPRVMLAAVLLACAATVLNAQFTFATNNGAISITGYTGPGGTVAIPSETNSLPVTSIGTNAFYGRFDLTGVTIPDSVTNIGDWAFSDCENLAGVTLGKSVTSIGYWTFSCCFNLEAIATPNSLVSIGDGAFFECNNLAIVTFGTELVKIGSSAFSYCDSLETVFIPGTVGSIGDAAFSDCLSLTSIVVAPSNLSYCSVDGVLFERNQATLIQYPPARAGANYTITNTVTSIGYAAFSSSSLTNISIPPA